MTFMNPFECEGQWFKANLHAHTSKSDGHLTLAEHIKGYRENGYDILAVTDHSMTHDVEGLSTDDFLVISGTETHPVNPKSEGPYHIVGLNVPRDIELSEDMDATKRIEIIKDSGGMAVFAHPYWCGNNINEMLAVKGYFAIEVFNSTCSKYVAKGISSVHWDDLLDAGCIVGGLAVDDVHTDWDLYRGWTNIKASELTVDAVMEALRKGCYYASGGPVIEDFRVEGRKVHLKCSPVKEIRFVGQRSYGYTQHCDGGELLRDAEFEMIKGMKYLRVEVIDENGKCAWMNPIIYDE